METFGRVLDQSKGFGRGFDFLRITLAVSIVCFHAALATGNDGIRETPLWFAEYALVPMFFTLSGFLITASGMRLSLKNFLINRGIRIVPALAVDVFMCALVIGPLFTTRTLSDYYTDSGFFAYFLNVFGYIHFHLPGVFETHHSTNVNGALWTVPYELICYCLISFLIVTKLIRGYKGVLSLILSMILLGGLFEMSGASAFLGDRANQIVTYLLVSRKSQIVTSFLFGILAYHLKDRIPYNKKLFGLCVLVCLATSIFFDHFLLTKAFPRLILLPTIAYITIFIGLTDMPIPSFFKKGDYSYGIYLYHDPFLQVVISLFPVLTGGGLLGTAWTLALGLPFVFMVAYLSWTYIEKPLLALRKKHSFVARARGVEEAETPSKEPLSIAA